MKFWEFAKTNQQLADKIQEQCSVTSLMSSVLSAKGMEIDEINAFLSEKPQFHNPFLMLGMDKAVKILLEAIEDGTKIAIFGDYDCDGVTATAILYHYLKNVGADVLFYIPSREGEGYGMNCTAITNLHAMGIELIVTVDNGISAIEEAALAREYGIKLIITDHHTPREVLPEADAIINPHQAGCAYPFKQLCGAGVAFKLVCALESDEHGYEMLEEYADLLAIGTVADIVELKDENRLFVKYGLRNLADTHRIGLEKLMQGAGLDRAALTSESIGFGIAPRINAAGRIATAEIAVLLLLTEYESEADEIAIQMEEYNIERKQLEKKIIEDIAVQIAADPTLVNQRVLVFSGTGWNAGVVGIVCSRLVARYGKPCVIIAIEGDEGRASGRSVAGFSLIDAIFACAELLTKYGGHPMAAGFSIPEEKITDFTTQINAYAKTTHENMPVDSLCIQCACEVASLTLQEIDAMSKLEPFGSGNGKPVFSISDAVVEKIVSMRENKHQKLQLIKDKQKLTALFFFTTKEELLCDVGSRVDIAFYCDVNTYNGERTVSLKGIDLRPAMLNQQAYFECQSQMDNFRRGELMGAQFVPTRDEIAIVYRFFKSQGKVHHNMAKLYFVCNPSNIDYLKFCLTVEILLELNLLQIENKKQEAFIVFNANSGRVQLENSTIIRSLQNNER